MAPKTAFSAAETGSPSQPLVIRTTRDFNRVRSRARTSEDFKALAAWCQEQVSKYQNDKAKNESELADYGSRSHSSNPKFRPLDETLRTYIAEDEKAIARWSVLVSQYTDQASKIEAAAQPAPR